MKRIKIKVFIASIVVIPIILFFVGSRTFLLGGQDIGPRVTIDNIRAIELGMSADEVLTILGEPYSREPPKPNSYSLNTWTYSRPVEHRQWYPMIWVHFDEGKVVEVYAKRYVLWGIDHVGVYGLNKDRQWEGAQFEETFPEDRSNKSL